MAHHFSVVLNGFHRNQSQSVTWLLEWTPFGSFESHGIQSWWGTKHEKTDRNHHHWTKGIPSVDHGQSWIPKVCRFGVNSTWLNYIYPRCPWDPSWSQCKCWTVGVLQELTTVDGVVSTWYGHGTWQIIQATNQYLSQHREYNQLHCFFLLLELGKLTINQWDFGVRHFESFRAIFVCRTSVSFGFQSYRAVADGFAQRWIPWWIIIFTREIWPLVYFPKK